MFFCEQWQISMKKFTFAQYKWTFSRKRSQCTMRVASFRITIELRAHFYRPQWFWEGYVFTPVCHSVHGRVCLSACWDTTPPEQTPRTRPPRADTPPRTRHPSSSRHSPRDQVQSRGRHPLGPGNPPGADPTPPARQTATVADGTHPTGIHSCTPSVSFNAVTMLRQLCDDTGGTALENGLQPHSGATPLFSMGTVSLASLQSCRCIDSDTCCKRALSWNTNTYQSMHAVRYSCSALEKDVNKVLYVVFIVLGMFCRALDSNSAFMWEPIKEHIIKHHPQVFDGEFNCSCLASFSTFGEYIDHVKASKTEDSA